MFNTIFYRPLYNILVWFVDVIPGHDAGIAVVCLTLLVSVALFSISKKAIKTQLALKVIEPELARIKAEITNKEEQAKQTLALYKKYKVNPFSMILMVIIQFPILIALYYVFKSLFICVCTGKCEYDISWNSRHKPEKYPYGSACRYHAIHPGSHSHNVHQKA